MTQKQNHSVILWGVQISAANCADAQIFPIRCMKHSTCWLADRKSEGIPKASRRDPPGTMNVKVFHIQRSAVQCY